MVGTAREVASAGSCSCIFAVRCSLVGKNAPATKMMAINGAVISRTHNLKWDFMGLLLENQD